MANIYANVRRVQKNSRAELEAGIKTKMVGAEVDGNCLGYKDAAGNMHYYTPEGGDAEYASLKLTELSGSGGNLAIDTEGNVYESDFDGVWSEFDGATVGYTGYHGWEAQVGTDTISVGVVDPGYYYLPLSDNYETYVIALGQPSTGDYAYNFYSAPGYIFAFEGEPGENYLGFGPGPGGGGGYHAYFKQTPSRCDFFVVSDITLMGTVYSYIIAGGDANDSTQYNYLDMKRIENGVTLGTITYPVAGSDYFKFDKPLKVYSSATQNASHNALSSVWLDGNNDCTISPTGVTLSAAGDAYIGFNKNGIDSYIDANNSMTLIGSEGTPGLSIKKAGVLGTIAFPITGTDYFNFNKGINIPTGQVFSVNGSALVSSKWSEPTSNSLVSNVSANTTLTGVSNFIGGYLAGNKLTSGAGNTAVGTYSLYSCLTQSYTVAIGYAPLYSLTAGSYTVAIGNEAGRYYGATGSTGLTSATDCIYIGRTVRANANTMTKEIAIGALTVGKGSNTTVIGADTAVGFYPYGINYQYERTAPTVGVGGFNGIYCDDLDNKLYSIGEPSTNTVYALNAIEKKYDVLGFVTPVNDTYQTGTYRQFFLSEGGCFIDDVSGASTRYAHNLYRSYTGSVGSYRYRFDGLASYYRQNAGQHLFYTYPTGLAGATGTANPLPIRVAADDLWSVDYTDYSATTTLVGWASTTTLILNYKRVGKTVFVDFNITGTSSATTGTNTSATLPYAPVSTIYFMYRAADNGTYTAAGMGAVAGASTTLTFYPTAAGGGGAWTASGSKTVRGQFFYQCE